MACFYVIYRYVFSKWRSIRLVETNHYDLTMTTHYDITMVNDVARDAHCEITKGNDVGRDIHSDIILSNGIAMCTYHGTTIHKNKNKFMFDQSGLENHSLFLCRTISLLLRTCEISLQKHNSCVLPRLVLVLVILWWITTIIPMICNYF